jgi:hypothetical protein
MAGPFLPARAAQPMDLLEKGAAGGGWEALEALMQPHLNAQPLQPAQTTAEFMWGLYQTPEGRAMFEWMMDISLRQPLRLQAGTLEQTAMNAAAKQAINGFAEAILAAIAHGETLINNRKTQIGAGA